MLRHDGFEETPWRRAEPTLSAGEAVHTLINQGRCVKLDLKEGGPTLSQVVGLVEDIGIDDDRVWFNSELPVLGPIGFESLRRRFPRSTISAPVDFLTPLLLASKEATDHTLRLLRRWGISRLSLRWTSRGDFRHVIGSLEARAWQINLYDIPDLERFLEATLLLPASITADFNFPEWRYYGRGSGASGALHRFDDADEGQRRATS